MNGKEYVKLMKRAIVNGFRSYKVEIKILRLEICDNGKRIIVHVKPKPGTKINSIFNVAPDVQTILGMPHFRPFRDGSSICIVIFGNRIENRLGIILQSDAFCKSNQEIPLAVGYDLRGEMYIADLNRLTHLLIGGATNMGKTVALICLIFSIITQQSPDRVNLILIDIGAGVLESFSNIPHLSCPIVRDEETGIKVMLSLYNELERRTKLPKSEAASLPYIVCIIDEFVSFVANIRDKETSDRLTNILHNLLRRGRHSKIHLVLATQDSKMKNLGIDLGPIMARMAFGCGNSQDSVSILGEGGAEKLMEQGAMLFKSLGHKKPVYLQGAYISKEDVARVIAGEAFRAMVTDEREYPNRFILPETSLDTLQTVALSNGSLDMKASERSEELCKVILWAFGQNGVSSNKIQKQFRMGKRADELMDQLFQMKLIADKYANLPRAVLPQCVEDVPTEVMDFLLAHGVTKDDITMAFQGRNTRKDDGEGCPCAPTQVEAI